MMHGQKNIKLHSTYSTNVDGANSFLNVGWRIFCIFSQI